MKSIKEKKIKLPFFLNPILLNIGLIFITLSCNNDSLNTKIIGKWAIKSIQTINGDFINVPEHEYYELHLLNKKNNRIFEVGDVSGNWTLNDSLLIFKNIPESKTPIDSIFVVNDSYGNSTVVLQNGNQKIATISSDGIEPEAVTSIMELIFIDDNEIHLLSDGDTYIYTKIIR
tara:strand:+ start:446 stop:967 length:522 start_codon:yes stop_codon:yes gene_type:complete